jgi:hypothetical protein
MRTRLAALWVSACACATLALGAEAQYFESPELDYWREGRSHRAEEKQQKQEQQERAPPEYLDPTKESFWTEGSYTPPRQVMEAAANATPENVARYIAWQKKKLDLAAAFQAEVTRQLSMQAPAPAPLERHTIARPLDDDKRGGVTGGAEALQSQLVPPDAPALARPPAVAWSQLQLLFFYQSNCPHCRSSVATVEELRRLGATVIPVQLDWQQRPPVFEGSVPYTAEIAERQEIQGVPYWAGTYQGERIAFSGAVSVTAIEGGLQTAGLKQRAVNQAVNGG